MKSSRYKSLVSILTLLTALATTGCEKPVSEEANSSAEEEAHDENMVVLTPQSIERAGIKIAPVELGRMVKTIKAAGRVSENLNKTARVASTLEGRLIQLNLDLNDPVKTGDVLALVQTPELLGKPLEIKAPRDGIITERQSVVGELVDKTTTIYTISDPGDLWVIAEVKERDLGALKPGQEATFRTLTYPGEEFHGRVARLGNQIETDARTLEARIETPNADGRLRPGMFADVEITTQILDGVVVVPVTAIERDGDSQVVFVETGEGKFEKRPVTLGLKEAGRTQVTEGLNADERVVTEGGFILKSEMLKDELGEE